MPNTPPISSLRLILRAFRPTDAEDLHAYLSDVNIYQFEPGQPINLEQARKMAGELANSPDFLLGFTLRVRCAVLFDGFAGVIPALPNLPVVLFRR